MTKEQMRENLEILNTMYVEEFSCMGEEVEYVFTKNGAEKEKALRKMGMTDEDLESMLNDEYLDLSYFAFQKLGADWWSKQNGFVML